MRKYRLQVIKISFLIISLSLINVATTAQKNVLLIMADDFNHWITKIGYYEQALTPNIDSLADMGVLFTDASCSSPVCNPSRNALMSGLRPSTTGIKSNSGGYIRDSPNFKNVITMNQYFTEQGYYTYAGGKIYHPGSMTDYKADLDNWSELYTGGSGASGSGGPTGAAWNWKSDHDGGTALSWSAGANSNDVEADADRSLARHFASKISNYSSSAAGLAGKPFFFACGLFRPHLPFNCNKDFFDLYDPDTLNWPKGILMVEDSTITTDPISDVHSEVIDEGVWKYAIRAYLANMSYADANVGVVMQALKNSDQASNTIVVFVGDHGWQLGEKRKWKKATIEDAANRTTLIIYDPAATGNGQVCHKVVSMQDIYPTLVDLCGLPERDDVEGNVITPLLQNPADAGWEKPILISYGAYNVIKTNEWRFRKHESNHPAESHLYDMINDPFERVNLIADAQYTNLIDSLSNQMDTIIKKGTDIKDEFFTVKIEAHSYHFEETLVDNTGNYPGTAFGNPIYTDGFHGKAIVFDGIDDYVEIENTLGESYTLDFWMNTTQTGETGAQWYDATGVIDGSISANSSTFGVSLDVDKASYGVGGESDDKTILSTAAVNNGDWQHITATRNADDGVIKLYVNGVEVANETQDLDPKGAASNLNIGRLLAGSNYYSGQVDLLTMHNYLQHTSLITLSHNYPGNLVFNAGFEFTEAYGWQMVRNTSGGEKWFDANKGVDGSSAFTWGKKSQNNVSIGTGVKIDAEGRYRINFKHKLTAHNDLGAAVVPSMWYYFYPSGEHFDPVTETAKLQANEIPLWYDAVQIPYTNWVETDTILTAPAGVDSLFVSVNWHKKNIAIDNFVIARDYSTPPDGINNYLADGKQITIYPNPVNHLLQIKGSKANDIYAIRSVTGQKLIMGKGSSVDVSWLESGVYVIEVGNSVMTFMKE